VGGNMTQLRREAESDALGYFNGKHAWGRRGWSRGWSRMAWAARCPRVCPVCHRRAGAP
jgi:hypothetical protein